jgi:hypothetical protein
MTERLPVPVQPANLTAPIDTSLVPDVEFP